MRFLSFLLILAALPAARADSGVADTKLLVVGDSLSAAYNLAFEDGWVHRLGLRLSASDCPVTVVNAAISGETSAGGLARLPKLLDDHQPAIVMIELGGNDGLRGFPVGDLRDNLDAMIRLSREAGAKVLLLGIQIPTNYGRRYTEALAGVYPDLAESHGLPLVPFLLEGVVGQPGMLQADGIHPTAAAQPTLVDNVWPALVPLLPNCELSQKADSPRPYTGD